MLRLENISAGYGAVTALRNVDMVVASGEVVALIGSNGAGKSTTLRTISGLVRPSTGKIEFQGEAITDLSPEQIVERGMIMTVDLHRFPTERGPFVGERFETIGLLRPRALLQPVAVDDGNEIVEPAMAGRHRGFPIRAFLQFAVAEHDEGAPARA